MEIKQINYVQDLFLEGNNFLAVKNLEIIAWRIINDQAVIVNLKEGTFNVLNLIATRIWELIDGRNTLNEIIEKIHQEFNINRGEIKRDCLEFIENMRHK